MDIPEKGPLSPVPPMDTPSGEKNTPDKQAVTAGTEPSKEADTVKLSERGREFKPAAGQAQSDPDNREDRIQRIRQQLANGTYRINENRLAGNLIDEAVENNAALKHIDTNA